MSLRKFVPPFWTNESKTDVSIDTSEYDVVVNRIGVPSVGKLVRVQNVLRYNMFLIRQQHLLALTPGTKYYEARRYVKIPQEYLESALQNNLDPRINVPVEGYKFEKFVHFNLFGNAVFVVRVVTSNLDENTFIPTRDSDFYIEYIIEPNLFLENVKTFVTFIKDILH